MNCAAKRMACFFIALVCVFNVDANESAAESPCWNNIEHALTNRPDSHIARELTLLKSLINNSRHGINILSAIPGTSYVPDGPVQMLKTSTLILFPLKNPLAVSSYHIQDLAGAFGAGLLDELINAGCLMMVEYDDEKETWKLMSYDRYKVLNLSSISSSDIAYDDYPRRMILTRLFLDLDPNIKKFRMMGYIYRKHDSTTWSEIWNGYNYK